MKVVSGNLGAAGCGAEIFSLLLGGPGPAGSGFGFNFPAEPGEGYVVQVATNLNLPVNRQTTTFFKGVNNTVQFTEATGSNLTARFYRVRADRGVCAAGLAIQ